MPAKAHILEYRSQSPGSRMETRVLRCLGFRQRIMTIYLGRRREAAKNPKQDVAKTRARQIRPSRSNEAAPLLHIFEF